MKKIEDMPSVKTRFHEEVFNTSDLNVMKGMYLAERLLRKWNEDFVDEDTGESVAIERNEILFDKGTFLSSDILSQINFYLQSQDIKEVCVSNQQRSGFTANGLTSVWSATVSVSNKKYTYLLYANSIELATKIVTDYLEQDIMGGFVLKSVKELNYSNLIPLDDDSEELDFYKIQLEVEYEYQEPFESSYILRAKDAESAKKAIVEFIARKAKDENLNDPFEVTIISAKTITCSGIVDYEFSQEYFENQE